MRYQLSRKESSYALLKRLLETIPEDDSCMEWPGSKITGYGKLSISGKARLAHRAAWEIVNGAIPDGLFACHRCDNPPCFRPSHLFLGTHTDNMDDCRAKGRKEGENSILTADSVRSIRESVLRGESQRSLAGRFGVHQSTVSNVVRGKHWRRT